MTSDTISEINEENISGRIFKKSLSDAVILTRNRKVFLQMRSQKYETIGTISLFGGHVEDNETPIETVIREIKEETGGKIYKKDLISLGAVTEAWTNHSEVVHIHFWHDKEGTITGCYEHSPIEFNTVDEALSDVRLMDYARWALKKVKTLRLID